MRSAGPRPPLSTGNLQPPTVRADPEPAPAHGGPAADPLHRWPPPTQALQRLGRNHLNGRSSLQRHRSVGTGHSDCACSASVQRQRTGRRLGVPRSVDRATPTRFQLSPLAWLTARDGRQGTSTPPEASRLRVFAGRPPATDPANGGGIRHDRIGGSQFITESSFLRWFSPGRGPRVGSPRANRCAQRAGAEIGRPNHCADNAANSAVENTPCAHTGLLGHRGQVQPGSARCQLPDDSADRNNAFLAGRDGPATPAAKRRGALVGRCMAWLRPRRGNRVDSRSAAPVDPKVGAAPRHRPHQQAGRSTSARGGTKSSTRPSRLRMAGIAGAGSAVTTCNSGHRARFFFAAQPASHPEPQGRRRTGG